MEASETQEQQQQEHQQQEKQEATDTALAEERGHQEGKAQAVRALHDVTFPRVISRIKGEGDEAEFATEGVNYPVGSVIHLAMLTPRDRARVEAGELQHLVEPVPDEIAQSYPVHETEPEFGVFIAEHEAEAYVLEQYGHQVVPKEQEMELLSASAEHTRKYQEQARQAGIDRRPHLEAMHQRHRERVPNEAFAGAEQRTGVPHYRGAEGEQAHEEGAEGAQEGAQGAEGQQEATRPAPPTEGQQEG